MFTDSACQALWIQKRMQQGPSQQGTYCLVGDRNTGIDAVRSGDGHSFVGLREPRKGMEGTPAEG